MDPEASFFRHTFFNQSDNYVIAACHNVVNKLGNLNRPKKNGSDFDWSPHTVNQERQKSFQ